MRAFTAYESLVPIRTQFPPLTRLYLSSHSLKKARRRQRATSGRPAVADVHELVNDKVSTGSGWNDTVLRHRSRRLDGAVEENAPQNFWNHGNLILAFLVALLCWGAPSSAYATPVEILQAAGGLTAGAGVDPSLREGILSGFLLILFSELGDKTFFIAVLLALKESKTLVFIGTFGALGVMTLISVGLGRFLHELDELIPGKLDIPFDDLLAALLLVYFGVKTLLDAGGADESAEGEREEAKEEVERFGKGSSDSFLLSTFILVFAAEWGDKSFLATIALAAASSPVGVVLGALAGHGLATGIAVLGGSFLGKYLSEKTVQYVGGSLFLVFAGITFFEIYTQYTA